MTLEDSILEKVRALPPEKRKEVLQFAASLSAGLGPRQPLRNPRGLWAEFAVDVSEEELAELRREMWKNFPREDA